MKSAPLKKKIGVPTPDEVTEAVRLTVHAYKKAEVASGATYPIPGDIIFNEYLKAIISYRDR